MVWFGLLWLAGMVLNIAAIGSLIKRVDRGGRESVARYLFAFVLLELVAMLVFALTGSIWLASRASSASSSPATWPGRSSTRG